jgi:hypothetical protein
MGWQENNPYPAQAGNPDVVIGAVTLNIGGAGAVSSVNGSPGVSAANTGAGTFSLTYPPGVDVYYQMFIQESATIFGIRGTARNAGAGTGTFNTYIANGTATNPAPGDEISIIFYARTSGA